MGEHHADLGYSHSLNWDYILGVTKGDARSLDNSSYSPYITLNHPSIPYPSIVVSMFFSVIPYISPINILYSLYEPYIVPVI